MCPPLSLHVMPVFEIQVAGKDRTACANTCEFRHPDYCVLFDDYLDCPDGSMRYKRLRACLAAEMQHDNYHTCVPLHLQQSTPSQEDQ